MAQANPGEKLQETPDMEMKDSSSVPFKLNAQAPEFVPRSHTQMPISGCFYPCFQFLGGAAGGGSDWFYLSDQDPIHLISNSNVALPDCSKNLLTNDLLQKIIKQVEYQFSDMSLIANDSLAKKISKDPQGYVPISVIASSKKIKSLVSNNYLLAQALRSSSKLVVSNDGKKVRRKYLFTDRDKEEFQSRTVVAENLPEDHSNKNLEKIFGVVGSVKTIRICHPQEFNTSRSKGDFLISNKLHALVEYETTGIAERAVEKLNDERNWRKGLRVRVLLRCSPKSVLKNKKDFNRIFEEDEAPPPESSEDSTQANNVELVVESNAEENSVGSRKGCARGRGKAKGRTQSHSGRGVLASSPQLNSCCSQSEASTKQITRGPRMPDGTRGFTMGRGKPISTTPALASSPSE